MYASAPRHFAEHVSCPTTPAAAPADPACSADDCEPSPAATTPPGRAHVIVRAQAPPSTTISNKTTGCSCSAKSCSLRVCRRSRRCTRSTSATTRTITAISVRPWSRSSGVPFYREHECHDGNYHQHDERYQRVSIAASACAVTHRRSRSSATGTMMAITTTSNATTTTSTGSTRANSRRSCNAYVCHCRHQYPLSAASSSVTIAATSTSSVVRAFLSFVKVPYLVPALGFQHQFIFPFNIVPARSLAGSTSTHGHCFLERHRITVNALKFKVQLQAQKQSLPFRSSTKGTA
ncbi:hypothetical protein BC828DRAFT_384441 [Blastocladiella britannica]|nr:hypothetical protein BC828DRAFT_384441 [Blastocladiella britannica]